MVKVEIIKDSIDHRGNRITTYVAKYTQTIVKEVLRHRMLSFSSSSMRAIPFQKVLDDLNNEFFSPIAWQKAHKGMQGDEYFTDPIHIEQLDSNWQDAMYNAMNVAEELSENGGATKQLCNRLLEPFGFVTMLITATEYDNFFELRCPQYVLSDGEICYSKADAYKFSCGNEDPDFFNVIKDFSTDLEWWGINESQAEIHIQELAEEMWNTRNESSPKHLNAGEWHIPFSENMDEIEIAKMASRMTHILPFGIKSKINFIKLMISAARCARVSYNTFEGEIDHEKDMRLAFMLADDQHWSPFEHSAQCMTDDEYEAFVRSFIDRDTGNIFLQEGWLANFRGFKQFRQML